jgi:hypothetical protein
MLKRKATEPDEMSRSIGSGFQSLATPSAHCLILIEINRPSVDFSPVTLK